LWYEKKIYKKVLVLELLPKVIILDCTSPFNVEIVTDATNDGMVPLGTAVSLNPRGI
jgi:hypothetical protein